MIYFVNISTSAIEKNVAQSFTSTADYNAISFHQLNKIKHDKNGAGI